MNQDTAKTNEIPELTDTTININIRTGLMHSNEREEAHTRVDYTGFYLSAINYFIRVALDAQSHLEMETNSIVLRNDVVFRENLQFLIQIQEAFAEWLPDYSNDLKDGSNETQETSAIADTPGESAELENLAVQISEVLQNPLLPVEVYNSILHGTDAIINSSNSADNAKYETSPEHIKAVLKISKTEATK